MKRRVPFAILSGARIEHAPEINEQRTAEVCQHLAARGLDVARVRGVYKGHAEPALIALLPAGTTGADWMYVRQVAQRYGQESILFVGADRSATLYAPRGDWQQHLGAWREATRADALAREAYTFNEATGAYYVAS